MDEILQVVRTVVSLAAVLGLLLFLSRRLQKGQAAGGNPFAALVPRRLLPRRLVPRRLGGGPLPRAAAPRRPQPEKITLVARTGLGGKAQLVVAEFGGIRYVLGVSEKGIDVVDTQEAPIQEAGAAPSENVFPFADAASERSDGGAAPTAA